MIGSSHTTVVNSNQEEVFSYLDKPKNHESFTPSLNSATVARRLDNGGKVADYEYRMFGLTFRGQLEEVEREENRLMVFDMNGDIDGRITIDVTQVGDNTTRVKYQAEYDLTSIQVVERLISPLVSSYNDVEVKKLLLNMKSDLESS